MFFVVLGVEHRGRLSCNGVVTWCGINRVTSWRVAIRSANSRWMVDCHCPLQLIPPYLPSTCTHPIPILPPHSPTKPDAGSCLATLMPRRPARTGTAAAYEKSLARQSASPSFPQQSRRNCLDSRIQRPPHGSSPSRFPSQACTPVASPCGSRTPHASTRGASAGSVGGGAPLFCWRC